MNSLCSDQLIQLALAGMLSSEEESTFNHHLDECERCAAEMERHSGCDAANHEILDFLTPDDLDAALDLQEECSTADFVVQYLDASDDAQVLGQLGGYDVYDVIGRGGMGIVLKGFDRELKRYVAIKALAPHLAQSALARKRFAREAQAAAAVVNPHVIAIHHVQTNGQLPFLVMPLLTGESLGHRLKTRGTLELTEILRIGMQAAEGLSAAHEQGLIHRDVKPANILLEKGVDRAVLTDFGLARAADDISMTRWGVIAGTPEYMSPEQARGETLDCRSDLFSVGSVLYEMATGVSPFRTDSSIVTMRKLVDEHPKSITSQNPELPPWFVGIVNRLLEKDPEKRFESAKQLSDLLGRCLAHVQQPTSEPLPKELSMSTHESEPVAAMKKPNRGLSPYLVIILVVGFLFLSLAVCGAVVLMLFVRLSPRSVETITLDPSKNNVVPLSEPTIDSNVPRQEPSETLRRALAQRVDYLTAAVRNGSVNVEALIRACQDYAEVEPQRGLELLTEIYERAEARKDIDGMGNLLSAQIAIEVVKERIAKMDKASKRAEKSKGEPSQRSIRLPDVTETSAPNRAIAERLTTLRLERALLLKAQLREGEVNLNAALPACQDYAEVEPQGGLKILTEILEIAEALHKSALASKGDLLAAKIAYEVAKERVANADKSPKREQKPIEEPAQKLIDNKASNDANPPQSSVEDEAVWSEPFFGMRIRMTAPKGNRFELGKPLPLLVELQNVGDAPIRFSDLHPSCHIVARDENGDWLGFPARDISLTPWERSEGNLETQAIISWTIYFERMRLVKPATGKTIQLTIGIPRQLQEPGKLPRTVNCKPVTLELVDKPLTTGVNRLGEVPEMFPERWSADMDVVYREFGGLKGKSRSIHIDGDGNVTLLDCGKEGRTTVQLGKERLDQFAAALKQTQFWRGKELAGSSPDLPEYHFCVASGGTNYLGQFSGLPEPQPFIQLQTEMRALIDDAVKLTE